MTSKKQKKILLAEIEESRQEFYDRMEMILTAIAENLGIFIPNKKGALIDLTRELTQEEKDFPQDVELPIGKYPEGEEEREESSEVEEKETIKEENDPK